MNFATKNQIKLNYDYSNRRTFKMQKLWHRI